MSTEEFNGHTGKLKIDAPGLVSDIEQLFSKEELNEIERLYAASFSDKPRPDEEELIRTKGANFNPFAARISAILLKEKLLSFELCKACMCLLHPKNSDSDTSSALAFKALQFLRGELTGVGVETEHLAFAILLDRCRHLHMRPMGIDEQKLEYSSARQIREKTSLPEDNRLIVLLDNWFTMVKSRYS